MKTADFLREKFSYSKCATVSRCLRKAFYRYVAHQKEPINPALLFGRGVHDGMEEDNYAKLRGERLPLGQIVEAGVEAVKHAADVEGIPTNEVAPAVDSFASQFERQVELYEESGIRATINPAPGSIEGAFQIDLKVGDPQTGLQPAILEGYTDVVSVEPDGERTMVDYKSAGKPTSQKEVENHTQLALEEAGSEASGSKIVTFVKHAKQKPTTKQTARVPASKGRLERALAFVADTIHAFRRALKTGDWPKCEPSAFHCQSGKACAYGHLCYPEKMTDLHEYVQVEKITPVGALPVQDWRQSLAGKREQERSTRGQ